MRSTEAAAASAQPGDRSLHRPGSPTHHRHHRRPSPSTASTSCDQSPCDPRQQSSPQTRRKTDQPPHSDQPRCSAVHQRCQIAPDSSTTQISAWPGPAGDIETADTCEGLLFSADAASTALVGSAYPPIRHAAKTRGRRFSSTLQGPGNASRRSFCLPGLWLDWDPVLREKIKALINARKVAGVTSGSELNTQSNAGTKGVYAARVVGSKGWPLYVRIGAAMSNGSRVSRDTRTIEYASGAGWRVWIGLPGNRSFSRRQGDRPSKCRRSKKDGDDRCAE